MDEHIEAIRQALKPLGLNTTPTGHSHKCIMCEIPMTEVGHFDNPESKFIVWICPSCGGQSRTNLEGKLNVAATH